MLELRACSRRILDHLRNAGKLPNQSIGAQADPLPLTSGIFQGKLRTP